VAENEPEKHEVNEVNVDWKA